MHTEQLNIVEKPIHSSFLGEPPEKWSNVTNQTQLIEAQLKTLMQTILLKIMPEILSQIQASLNVTN